MSSSLFRLQGRTNDSKEIIVGSRQSLSPRTTIISPRRIQPITIASLNPISLNGGLSSEQMDILRFWTPQMKEHALFCYAGIVPLPADPVVSPLLSDASMDTSPPSVVTQVPLKTQIPNMEHAANVAMLKESALAIFKAWTEFEKMVVSMPSMITVKELSRLVGDLRQLKTNMITLQQQKVWIGWLFPEFVDHILRELEYFVVSFNGQLDQSNLSLEQRNNYKRSFWTEINAEHTAFAASLLNPSKDNMPVIQQAMALSVEGRAPGELKTLNPSDQELVEALLLSRTFEDFGYAIKVDQLMATAWNNGSPSLVSVIHPLLLAHVIREGQRAIQELAVIGVKASGSQEYDQLSRHIGGVHQSWPRSQYTSLYPPQLR